MPMPEITFPLTAEFIELHKLLKATGLCESGGLAKYMISESKVLVDGKVETRKACKIRRGQRVEYDGQTISVL